MFHIKRFNESTSTTENKIEEITKECLYDFRLEYGLKIKFEYGRFFEKYRFVSDNEMKLVFNKPNDIFNFLPYKKSVRVILLNEVDNYYNTLEIQTDKNSNKEFEIAINTLESSLQDITDIELEDIPSHISPSLYSISFIINYK